MWSFIKRVIKSRVGHLLLVLNICILLFGYGDSYAAQHVHGEDCLSVEAAKQIDGGEVCYLYSPLISLLLLVGVLLELPSLLLAIPFNEAFEFIFPYLCTYTASHIGMLILIAISSCQWLLVGLRWSNYSGDDALARISE